MNPVSSFFTAIAFFTRVPIPQKWQGSKDLSKSVFFYPFAGLLIGALTMLLVQLLALHVLEDSLLVKIILFMLPLLLSGGLHLDGLADSADALFYAGDKTRRLEIMRDSKLGVYGVTALVMDLILRWACIGWLIENKLFWPILLMPFMGKLGILFTLGFGRSPSQEGPISAAIANKTSMFPAVFWVLVAAALWYQLVAPDLYTAIGFVLVVSVISFWAYKKIGAACGDLCGFVNEVWELAFLIAIVYPNVDV